MSLTAIFWWAGLVQLKCGVIPHPSVPSESSVTFLIHSSHIYVPGKPRKLAKLRLMGLTLLPNIGSFPEETKVPLSQLLQPHLDTMSGLKRGWTWKARLQSHCSQISPGLVAEVKLMMLFQLFVFAFSASQMKIFMGRGCSHQVVKCDLIPDLKIRFTYNLVITCFS